VVVKESQKVVVVKGSQKGVVVVEDPQKDVVVLEEAQKDVVEDPHNLVSSEVSQDATPVCFRLVIHVAGWPPLRRQGLPEEEVSANRITRGFMVLTATTMKMAVGLTIKKRDVLK
jgi:hypothetical protein